MMTNRTIDPRAVTSKLRIGGWGFLGAVLLIPAIAMQFTSEVNWTMSDFVFAAIMFIVLGGAIEFLVRAFPKRSTRSLAIVAVVFAFLWLWAELAVGVFTDWGS